MQTVNFEEAIEKILTDDKRFQREAYVFVREGLDHTQKNVAKNKKDDGKHVSGQQLLEGVREYALEQYGPMTFTVLEEWGITKCEDIGEIVFNMVKASLLKKTDKDSPDDFKSGYDFHDAFRAPYLPTKKVAPAPVEEVKSGQN
jgi:uncharacterized repeat protein (TIGR04138 family)